MLFEHMMKNVSGKGIVKYATMPGIAPRINNFILSGFGNLAFFMAMIYQAVKLLPANHPYLQREMAGKYSIRDVLTEASKNVIFDLKHIDQIIIFFALIAGIVILAIQFILLISALLMNPASAQAVMPTGYGQFFTTPNPANDIAFRLLDRVFGVPGIFGSIEPTATVFHTALHGLFQFYSIGLLIVAAMIMTYFIFVVLAETAQTGTPFGKRFNHAWAPIRLVVAIGLLIPISYGLNSGQWITLYAAKMGSGFATNGWIMFNDTLRSGTANTLGSDVPIATPNIPSFEDISAFMMMAQACRESYQIQYSKNIEIFQINKDLPGTQQTATGIYRNAVNFSNKATINIVFGELNPTLHSEHVAGIFPYCGELELTILKVTPPQGTPSSPSPHFNFISSPEDNVNEAYLRTIISMWNNPYAGLRAAAQNMALERLLHPARPPPPATLKQDIENANIAFLTPLIQTAVTNAIAAFAADTTYATLGWGGAGIWYNDIANANGQITNAIMNIPQIDKYASVMEFTCKENQKQNANTAPKDCYNPLLSKGQPVEFTSRRDVGIARVMNAVFSYWHEDPEEVTGNAFIDTINAIFGTQGLFDMCANATTHPLAQLSTMGKGLVEAAIRNLGFALGTGVAGILTPYIGPALSAASSFFVTVASIGILIGFMLYYIVPFMPFLYFLFAVGGWVKGIFEAMVGVPLWALAHLRIDGQGLPGDGAINGYFLIFEIFIRPILIVFGLIAAVLIFGALVKVLNEIFSLVVTNLAGNDPNLASACGGGSPTTVQASMQASTAATFRGPVDELFYTIVYAILVYMMGMSSFKLIDLIPNNILRWMGQGVQTFNDQAGEPAEGLMTKMAVGGSLMGGQLQQAGSAAGQAAGGFAGAAKEIIK